MISIGHTFLDGPAAGFCVAVARAPILLRVVCDRTLKFDCLDQLDDTPKPDETIFVYIRASLPQMMHVRRDRRAGGSFSCTAAQYRLWPNQPDDSWLRTKARWDEWCDLVKDEAIRMQPPEVQAAFKRARTGA